MDDPLRSKGTEEDNPRIVKIDGTGREVCTGETITNVTYTMSEPCCTLGVQLLNPIPALKPGAFPVHSFGTNERRDMSV